MRRCLVRGAVWISTALLVVLGISTVHAAPPVVPGFDRLQESRAGAVEQGELLLGELNCLSCHTAPDAVRVLTKGAPELADAGARLTPQYLRAYLADPHHVKPGTTMPDVFHSSAPEAKQGAVEFLTHFLVSLGGPIKPSREAGNKKLVEQGRHLYSTIGCVACHAPEKSADLKVPSVPLGDLARKTTVEQLIAFLQDPAKFRPGSRMPATDLTSDEATAIAVYLLREQIENPQAKIEKPVRARGLQYTYYETDLHTADPAKLGKLTAKAQGRTQKFDLKLDGLPESDFALKMAGLLAVPEAGKYTFYTKSDDGSRLYIDGKLIVNNDSDHAEAEQKASIELTQGDHPIVVTYYQAGGDRALSVSWKKSGGKKESIPSSVLYSISGQPMVPLESEKFLVDPQKAQMGRMMFSALGCAGCHTNMGIQPMRPPKTLAALNVDSPDGCLAKQPPKGRPKYDLSADQRAALKAALQKRSDLSVPRSPKSQVAHMMAAMNCYACHKRDGAGGPEAARAEFFVMNGEFDMGDEGRLPPTLTGAGDKLLPEAIDNIVFEGKLHVRPVLATRMPRFKANKMPGFAPAMAAADAVSGEAQPPAFNEASAKAGRELVGVKGLGCVNCHGVNGVKSLGMPGPDLGAEHERLRYPWLRRLLNDPASLNPGTRMPAFWTGGAVALPHIAGGTVEGQQNAIWNYLSLGRSMPLPDGLQLTASMELVPTDEPIVHRTMMNGAGNRSVLVGFPEQLSVAFDADVVRMVEAWRGRFFDAKGWWESRGGKHMDPLGSDVLKLPPGPAFALLRSQGDPWPQPKAEQRNTGGQFKGYTLDKQQRPIFHYVLDGIDIQEQPLPLLKPGGASLIRRFELSERTSSNGLYFLAAQGRRIEAKGNQQWLVDGRITVTLRSQAGGENLEPVVRDSDGQQQLLLPVTFKSGKASFEVEMSW